MVYRVEWSPDALADIESIADFIERDSPAYAKAVTTRILKAARQAKRFPFAGRAVPESEDGTLREIFVYDYRLIYRVSGRTIVITAVIHGKRLLAHVRKGPEKP